MARPHANTPGHPVRSRPVLPFAVALLALLALVPTGWLGWAAWFRQLAETIVTPISHPIAAAAGVFSPSGPPPVTRELRDLELELQTERRARLQAEQRAQRLAEQVAELSRGAQLAPVAVRQLVVAVVGSSGGSPMIRAGTNDAVTPNAVATSRGIHLLGRVDDVGVRTSRLSPFTARSQPPIMGAIMLDEGATVSLACQLTPVGDGTLRGDAESTGADDRAAAIAPGMVVRLRDDQWPEHAQMLILGRVERVDPHERMPLRRVVTVRPEVDPMQAREAVLRMPEDPEPTP